jgi:RimJ/RimL family protein N-acetyltransferase
LAGEGDYLALAVVWREVGRVVGEVNLGWTSRVHRQGEFGFVFNPEFQGRGLATEAAREMLRLGFDGLGLHRIFGRCDAQNTASARLMERLGMRREATSSIHEIFKGEWATEFYAMLDDEWRAHNKT